jgi:succinoglycan biosynthesis transport protein ExoP
MAEPGVETTLRGYLHVLRGRRWWVVALTVLGLGASMALSLTATKEYSATAQMLMQSTSNVNLSSGGAQAAVTSADVQTELQLVTSAQVQEAVRKKLGSVPGISAAEVGQTNVIAVTAVDHDPARAATIANTYARAFVTWSTQTAIGSLTTAENQLGQQISVLGKQIKSLPKDAAQAVALSNQQAVLKGQLAQLEVAGATASTGLQLVTPAVTPTSPSSPKPVQDAILGLLAGLVLGIGAALLRDNLDDTLTSGESVEQIVDAPVLASVPVVASWRKKSRTVVISVTDPTSQPAEAYRSLRTSLQFAGQDRPLRTILVTSPNAGDGKTMTTVNLGAVFAQAGARVVLVSCDLRRPGLSQFFAPSEQADLSSVLLGQRQLEDAVIPVPDLDGLYALGTRAADNPTELLAGPRMREVIAELTRRFDLVLIDSPPVLPVADAIILSGLVDGVLVVAAGGQTRRAELRRTSQKLAQGGAPVIGAVLNKSSAQGEYGYYDTYQPYVLPASASRHARGRENGMAESSGQPGRPGH